jgi:hypothetical protein
VSQDELAQRMVDRGFGFSQATIWKIEQAKRPVKISEALALMDALELRSWINLAREPHAFRYDAQLQDAHRYAAVAYNALKDAATEYLRAQADVGVVAHEAREVGQPVNELWLHWLNVPGERAVIEARIEWYQEDDNFDRRDKAVNKILHALREQGFEAIIDLNAVETVGGEASAPDPK